MTTLIQKSHKERAFAQLRLEKKYTGLSLRVRGSLNERGLQY